MRWLLVVLLLSAGGCRFDDYDEDGVAKNNDCDNFDPTVYPGAPELCDGRDNNCDGVIDEGSEARTFHQDADGDGFGNSTETTEACAAPRGYTDNELDCDDTNPFVSPAAAEECADDIDNDCDGLVDEDGPDAPTWYIDADGDDFGSDSFTMTACEEPSGFVDNDDDCNDGAATAHPGGTETCDGLDNDCDGTVDGPEVGESRTFWLDADDDGYGDPTAPMSACAAPPDHVLNDQDCDDDRPEVNPAADELCSGEDLDCDDVLPPACTSCLDTLDNGDASAGDGIYTVDPDGPGGSLGLVDVWCDMTTDGGGWTLLQRTLWAWSENQPLRTGYDDWYDLTLGDPAPGSAYRIQGYAWPFLDHLHDHLLAHRARTTTGGACDPLYYKATNGVLSTTASSAFLTGAQQGGLALFNGTELSTLDSGPSACGSRTDTVAWFYANCCTTCPTYKGPFWSDEPHPMANYLVQDDLFGNDIDAACGGATPLATDIADDVFGEDSLEYYVR